MNLHSFDQSNGFPPDTESLGVCIIVVDPDERILYVNSHAETIFGVPANKITGSSLSEFTTPATFELIRQHSHKNKSGETNVYDIEIIRPDGELRILHIIENPRFEKQQYIGGTRILVDITKLIPIESALIKSEEHFRSLLHALQRRAIELSLVEQVHTAISKEVALPEMFQTVVNMVSSAFGYTQVSIFLIDGDRLVLQNQTGYDNIPLSIPIHMGITGKVARSGIPLYLPDVKRDPNFIEATEDVVSEICVPLYDQEKIIGVFNIESTNGVRLTDADFNLVKLLSEQISIAIVRANLYEELRKSETSYRTLANNLPGIVYRVHLGKNETTEFFNNGLCELTGFTQSELRRDKDTISALEKLIVPEDRGKTRSIIQLSIKQGQPFEVEYRIRHKDGSLRHFVERGRPIQDSQNKSIYIDGVILDNTERKQNEERLTRAALQMESLYTTSLVVNSNTNLSSLLSYIVKQAVLMSGTSTGCLYLIKPDQDILEMVASYNLPFTLTGITLKLSEGLSGKVAQSGETMFVTNYSDWEGHAIPFEQVTTRRVLAVPLRVKGHVIGVINVADSKNTDPFTMEEIRLLTLFADQAAIAVENARLYARLERQAIIDELTGLYNRRALMELGKREVERARRFNRPLCALFIDIDFFKKFNDQYGHTAGDFILRTVALILRNGIRDIDLASRFGGEEFVILLVESNADAASNVAERLRKQVEITTLDLPQGKLGVTVSMGVAPLDQNYHQLEDLIDCADQAMYQSKQAGRNRVTIWHAA